MGCIFSLLVIPLFRSAAKLLPGTESYFILRMAENPSFTDALSFGGRFAAYPLGFPYLLRLLPKALVIAVPFVLGILSFVLFLLVLKRFDVKPKKTALAVLLLSPAFIYQFNTLNTSAPALFLALLGFWVFTGKKKYFSIPVFALIPLFDLTIGILSMVLFFFYAFFQEKQSKNLFYASLAAFMAVAGAYYGYIIKNAGFSWPGFSLLGYGFNSILQSIISDFGAPYGIGIFALILAVFGVIASWDRKYKDKFAFFSIASLLIAGVFFPKALFILNLFIAVFAAIGFMELVNSRWENRIFQRFVLLIMVCGIIFSAISFSQQFVNSAPDEGITQGIEALMALPDGVVFSQYSRGHWISFAGKQNVIDENIFMAPDVKQRFEDSEALFRTRDLARAAAIMRKYGIKYIWIDSGMRKGIWEDNEEGLLFLLKYNSDLDLQYARDGVEIWEVKNNLMQ